MLILKIVITIAPIWTRLAQTKWETATQKQGICKRETPLAAAGAAR